MDWCGRLPVLVAGCPMVHVDRIDGCCGDFADSAQSTNTWPSPRDRPKQGLLDCRQKFARTNCGRTACRPALHGGLGQHNLAGKTLGITGTQRGILGVALVAISAAARTGQYGNSRIRTRFYGVGLASAHQDHFNRAVYLLDEQLWEV